MPKEKISALKMSAIGCAIMVTVPVVLLLILTWSIFHGYEQAMNSREALEASFATQTTYTPALDGTIKPNRLRRFIEVRKDLEPRCRAVSLHQDRFLRMQTAANSQEPAPSEFFKALGPALVSVPKIGFDFGRYVRQRNESLFENEMGLGEYSWIYVTVYFSLLENRPTAILSDDRRTNVYYDRVFPEIRAMIERVVSDLNAADISHEYPQSTTLTAYQDELHALSDDPRRVPFADGLPPEFEASLAPFRDELERLACPLVCDLEVIRTEKDGVGYSHE